MLECKKCLFTSLNYPKIKLDDQGVCDICSINMTRIKGIERNKSDKHVTEMVDKIKSSRKGKYDCLIGISGGVDSTYLVYLAKKWGLSPLLLHIDGGWNSEISVINIEKIVDNSGFDFVTEVLPWKEMRDTQRAFIKANVLDIDLPFDNAMLNYNYTIAKKYNIRYVLNGYSTSTEGIMPENFTHYKLDKCNILDIHKKFGKVKLKQLKFIGTLDYYKKSRVSKLEFLHPLDWIDYNKKNAQDLIKQEFNWKEYGGKHYENLFTRFYQGHILPKKYNVDKRISHFSMLICNGDLSKEEAQEALKNQPLYPSELMERDDKLFFCKKLRLSEEEFKTFMNTPGNSHRNFKSDLDYYDFFRPVYQRLKKVFKFEVFKN